MKGLHGSEMVIARPMRGPKWKGLFRAILHQEVAILFHTSCAMSSGRSLGKGWIGRQKLWQVKLKIPMQEQVLLERKIHGNNVFMVGCDQAVFVDIKIWELWMWVLVVIGIV